MPPNEIDKCDVAGCCGLKRHDLNVGPQMVFSVCDRCQDAVYALGRAFDREHITLNEKYFELFRELKGEGDAHADV